jgi:hypothetical protein
MSYWCWILKREYLLLLLGLVFMVLSIATSLLASERVVEKHTEKTTHIGDKPMLIPCENEQWLQWCIDYETRLGEQHG